jgi:hypothetical protein
MQLTGCASNWSIVRDGEQKGNVSKLVKPVGNCAFVFLNDTPDIIPSSFFVGVQEQLVQSGAFNEVKVFDGITPIGPGDVLIRATASRKLPSERGVGQSKFDWRMILSVGGGMGGGVALALATDAEDIGSLLVISFLTVPVIAFLPTNYVYVEDAYPYIRYFELAFLRSDGVELATYISRQTAALERQTFSGGDEGNQEIDNEAGRLAAVELVSEFQADSKAVASILNQQQDMKRMYGDDVLRMMNFQLAMESFRNKKSQVQELANQDVELREKDIQSTIDLHERIGSGLQKIAQTLQSQSAATAGPASSGATVGGGPMSNPELQAAAKNCEKDPLVLRFSQQAQNTVNISASYCAAAALAQCYIDHGLYGGTTGITLDQLQRMVRENRDIASRYNNQCR